MKYSILLIEDSEAFTISLQSYLSSIINFDYQLVKTSTLSEGVSKLDCENIDVVLIDLNLLDSNSDEEYQELFEYYAHIPFIVLTNETNQEIALKLIREGAYDFLLKGHFDATLLYRSIIYTLQRKELENKHINEILITQDKEKERVSREVHDSLGQSLTSLLMKVQFTKGKLSKTEDFDVNEIAEDLNQSISNIKDIQEIIRNLSRSLMPQTLRQFGLKSAIESLLFSFDKENLTVEFNCNFEEERFDYDIELGFFRIAQESINNSLKYSESELLRIDLTLDKDSLRLDKDALEMDIIDNGNGFDTEDKSIRGIGFNSITTRASAISAKLIYESTIGKGTHISVIKKLNHI